MKKILSIFLLLMLVSALLLSVTACGGKDDEEKEKKTSAPNSDPYEARKFLEENGYNVEFTDLADTFPGLVACIMANLGEEEYILIYYFEDKESTNAAWEEGLEELFNRMMDNAPSYVADKATVKKSGKMAYFATEKAIKATNKKLNSNTADKENSTVNPEDPESVKVCLMDKGFDVTSTQDPYNPDSLTTIEAFKINHDTGATEILLIYFFESEEMLNESYESISNMFAKLVSEYQNNGVYLELINTGRNILCIGTRDTVNLLYK
jgi:hypothetical protein